MSDARQVSDLGSVVRSHRIPDDRRLGQGIGLTIVGGLITLISIPIVAAYVGDANSSGFSMVPGVILGVGVALLVLGPVRLTQRFLRPGERFDVHEHGLTHVTARQTRPVPWAQIAALRELGSYHDSGFRHALGVDYRCVVLLKDGTKLRFNTLIEDADVLSRTIGKHVA